MFSECDHERQIFFILDRSRKLEAGCGFLRLRPRTLRQEKDSITFFDLFSVNLKPDNPRGLWLRVDSRQETTSQDQPKNRKRFHFGPGVS